MTSKDSISANPPASRKTPMTQTVCPLLPSRQSGDFRRISQQLDADRSQEVDRIVSLFKHKSGLVQLQDLERDRAQEYADTLDAVCRSVKPSLQLI